MKTKFDTQLLIVLRLYFNKLPVLRILKIHLQDTNLWLWMFTIPPRSDAKPELQHCSRALQLHFCKAEEGGALPALFDFFARADFDFTLTQSSLSCFPPNSIPGSAMNCEVHRSRSTSPWSPPLWVWRGPIESPLWHPPPGARLPPHHEHLPPPPSTGINTTLHPLSAFFITIAISPVRKKEAVCHFSCRRSLIKHSSEIRFYLVNWEICEDCSERD